MLTETYWVDVSSEFGDGACMPITIISQSIAPPLSKPPQWLLEKARKISDKDWSVLSAEYYGA